MSGPSVSGNQAQDAAFSLHHSDSSLDQLTELIEDMKHGLSPESVDLGKSYRDGELYVLVDVGGGGGGTGDNFEAIFGAVPNCPFPLWEAACARSNGHSFQGNMSLNQVGMFIDEVEVMEGTEKITVPSIVWLKRGNSRTDGLGNFLALLGDGSLEPRLVDSMREIRSIRRLSRKHGTATCGLVESGSKVIDGVCGREAQIARKWFREVDTNKSSIPRFRVKLGEKLYVVTICDGFEGGEVINSVAFGPFNL